MRAERVPSNKALGVSFAVVALSTGVVTHITSDAWAIPYALLFGMANGGKEALDALVWADYFGRRSVGGIRGLSRPFVIGAAASGPVLSGVGYDRTGSYESSMFILAGLASIGAAAAFLSRRPTRGNDPSH